jgi:hypothetical protein
MSETVSPKEWIEAATDAADFIEDNYRSACGLASKKEKDAAVAKHAILAPLRRVIAEMSEETRVPAPPAFYGNAAADAWNRAKTDAERIRVIALHQALLAAMAVTGFNLPSNKEWNAGANAAIKAIEKLFAPEAP